MRRTAVRAKFLIIPALILSVNGPAPIASAHSSGGLPPGPAIVVSGASGAGNDAAFINFETPHVHPLDISPDANWLAACNTPDGRVEIYSINQTTGALTFSASVTVGVDPVSVRFRTNDEIWAVNAISDSISVIDRTIGQVTDTIVTYRLADTGSVLEGSPNGDEPMDVVFINSGALAVVSCTRTDILQLYDTSTLGLLDESLRLDGEEPRALATDGTAVWAAIFESGNGTTSIMGVDGNSASFPPQTAIESASNPYGGQPAAGEYFHDAAPASGTGWNVLGVAVLPGDLAQTPPRTSVIVRSDGNGGWLDDNGRDWAAFVDGANAAQSGRVPGWTLLDNDIARVVENTNALSEDTNFGTDGYATRQMNIVMAIARNPVTGNIFSVGTDATNEIRFEPNIAGRFTRVLLSVVSPTTGAEVIPPKDLNAEHLAFAQFLEDGINDAYHDGSIPAADRQFAIGDPRGIAFTPSGNHAYISGMGSNNIICVLASGGSIGNRVSLAHKFDVGAGPTGLAHHPTLNRLYVLSKFASRITVVDTTTPGSEANVQMVNIYDPTPSAIKEGRPHLYDTHANSGLGHIACASCHVDVRFDRLGWNLGNPLGEDPESPFGQGIEKQVHGEGDGLVTGSGTNPIGRHNTLFVPEVNSEGSFGAFSSMKGVMTTQTLQDIIGKEPFHWRGDRDGIEEFAGAFAGLQGRDNSLDPVSMQQFKNFLASVWFEPNPMRPLDNALPGGPPLSSAYAGNHDNLDIPGHFSPGTSTGKVGFSALGTQLPPGNAFFGFGRYVDTTPDNIFSCVVCHTLPIGSGSTQLISLINTNNPPDFSATPIPQSSLGSEHLGMVSIDGTGQPHIKVAHLRNQIDKEGFYLNFGVPSRAGFGVLHDGAIDGLARFIGEPAFDTNFDQDLADLVAFNLCVRGDDILRLQGLAGAPTGPIPPAAIEQSAHAAVGAQAVMPPNGSDFYADVLIDVAADNEIDLVVETRAGGVKRRFTHYDDSGGPRFLSDRSADGLQTLAEIEAITDPGSDLLFTGLHETTGKRIGIDRDEDGAYDGDETVFGSDIANSNDNGFVGSTIPAEINPLDVYPTPAAAVAGVTPTSGKKALIHIQGGFYWGPLTITQRVVLRKLVDPVTGATVGPVVRIGAP